MHYFAAFALLLALSLPVVAQERSLPVKPDTKLFPDRVEVSLVLKVEPKLPDKLADSALSFAFWNGVTVGGLSVAALAGLLFLIRRK